MPNRIDFDSIKEKSRILIVDDMEDNLFILTDILQRAGYLNVRAIQNPLEAEGIVEEWQPDILLLDLEMPDMSGFEVMEMAHKKANSYTPALILTARSDKDTKLEALERGARDFIAKPFDAVEVEYRIRNNLEAKLLYKEVQEYSEELEEKVRERTKEVVTTRREIVSRLAAASEYRDDDTGNHIYRMSHYAYAIALEAGLPEDEAELILNAAPMHDVGKIGMPDGILLKKGPLTKEEWNIMRTHSEIGEQILGNDEADLLKMARVIARHHHERWDGNGYPDKLSGEDIPIAARVTAVADVFDALTSQRPYKDAWSVDEAVNEIADCSGAQFDPHLVDAFRRALPRILEIKEEFAD